MALLHYFQRTVENFLLKRDISLPHQRQRGSRPLRAGAQSEPSGIRSLCAMYDNGRFGQARDCRSLRAFPFSASYVEDVARLLEATIGWGDAGRARQAPPRRDGASPAKEVHDMFRHVIASGRAFSPELYARMVPFDRAQHCDALQHYLGACCERGDAARLKAVARAREWIVERPLIPQLRCLAQPNWTAWRRCILRLES